jgi:hypothetical protein
MRRPTTAARQAPRHRLCQVPPGRPQVQPGAAGLPGLPPQGRHAQGQPGHASAPTATREDRLEADHLRPRQDPLRADRQACRHPLRRLPPQRPAYKEAPRTCIGCHRKDDDGAAKGHRGRFGEKCESCHGTKAWKPHLQPRQRHTLGAARQAPHGQLQLPATPGTCSATRPAAPASTATARTTSTRAAWAASARPATPSATGRKRRASTMTAPATRCWASTATRAARPATGRPLQGHPHPTASAATARTTSTSQRWATTARPATANATGRRPRASTMPAPALRCAKRHAELRCDACHSGSRLPRGAARLPAATARTTSTKARWAAPAATAMASAAGFRHRASTMHARALRCATPMPRRTVEVQGLPCRRAPATGPRRWTATAATARTTSTRRSWARAARAATTTRAGRTCATTTPRRASRCWAGTCPWPAKSCHKSLRYRDAARDCDGCHRKDDKHALKLRHCLRQLPQRTRLALWTFDHQRRTRFALDGAHQRTPCDRCHTRARPPRARPSPTWAAAALACHARDDKHDGAFGAQCERCHDSSRWGQVTQRLGAMPPAAPGWPLLWGVPAGSAASATKGGSCDCAAAVALADAPP